ncbi:MAG: biopolymer transporter ExbD [Candidatus Latescibacterota bacterium]|nr:MAG: biopolymer transporter ExbD [Candidatus Latescibacterota bacterium]
MRKAKARIGVAIDMTPMVDVAFLLLIFFMTTTTFKPPEEVTVELPLSHAEYKVPESDVLIVTITHDEKIYSQLGTHDPMSSLEFSQIGDLIRSERSRNRKLRLIVKADRELPYGLMEDLMNVLQDAQATRFVLMTEGEAGMGQATKEVEEGGLSMGDGAADKGAGELAMARPEAESEVAAWVR